LGYDKEWIFVGELVSLTGAESTFGLSAHQAAELAVSEINDAGGLNVILEGRPQKRKIKLITRDTASNREKAGEADTELIEKQNVIALIGEVVSDRTRFIAPIAQKNRIPLISPASTNPALTEIGDYIFRACYIDPFQGYVMAKFAYDHLRLRRIAVLKDYRSGYSAGLSEYFVDTFTTLHGQIVTEQTYATTDTNFDKQVAEIKKFAPDAVFIPGYYTQVAEIAKRIRKSRVYSRTSGKPTLLLGGDGWDSRDLFKFGGQAVVGGYFTNHFTADSTAPLAREYVKKYVAKFKVRPDGTAAVSYDAFGILFQAMKLAFAKHSEKPDRKELTHLLRGYIAKTKNYSGVTGTISLNENRDAIKPAVVNRVEGENTSYVTTISP